MERTTREVQAQAVDEEAVIGRMERARSEASGCLNHVVLARDPPIRIHQLTCFCDIERIGHIYSSERSGISSELHGKKMLNFGEIAEEPTIYRHPGVPSSNELKLDVKRYLLGENMILIYLLNSSSKLALSSSIVRSGI